MENSDSAEEVAWAPRQPAEGAASAAADALGLPRNMRQETSAAINLMAMSFKDDKEGHHHSAAAASSPPAQPLAGPQSDAGVPHQDPQVQHRAGFLVPFNLVHDPHAALASSAHCLSPYSQCHPPGSASSPLHLSPSCPVLTPMCFFPCSRRQERRAQPCASTSCAPTRS